MSGIPQAVFARASYRMGPYYLSFHQPSPGLPAASPTLPSPHPPPPWLCSLSRAASSWWSTDGLSPLNERERESVWYKLRAHRVLLTTTSISKILLLGVFSSNKTIWNYLRDAIVTEQDPAGPSWGRLFPHVLCFSFSLKLLSVSCWRFTRTSWPALCGQLQEQRISAPRSWQQPSLPPPPAPPSLCL